MIEFEADALCVQSMYSCDEYGVLELHHYQVLISIQPIMRQNETVR